MTKISIIIVTLNEERTINRAIASVKQLSDDIVVVDSGSTDNTVEIAKKLGAHTVFHVFENFADQRSFANSCTKHEWVLSMDADEEIPRELLEELQKTVQITTDSAYLIPRRNIIFGKEIKHTRWSPDAHVWLYDKTKGSWVGSVHEEWVSTESVGILKNAKLHHSHPSVSAFMDMLNRYTDIESLELYKNGTRFSMFSLLFYSTRSFVGRFLIKQGYLDGLHGFVLSSLMAFYRFTTWVKIWELQKHE